MNAAAVDVLRAQLDEIEQLIADRETEIEETDEMLARLKMSQIHDRGIVAQLRAAIQQLGGTL